MLEDVSVPASTRKREQTNQHGLTRIKKEKMKNKKIKHVLRMITL
jgi:hypothetical protein